MNKIKQRLTAFVKGRNFPTTVLTATVIAIVVFVNIIIYTISTVYPLYLYKPETADLSISSSSDALFEGPMRVGRTVTVTFCMYEDDLREHTMGSFVYETAQQFAERYPGFVQLRYINAITKLDSDGKSVAEELELYAKDGTPINKTSVIFSTDTSFKVVTDTYTGTGYADFFTIDDNAYVTSYNGEEKFASTILWVLNEEHGTAYFTTGHGETANLTFYNILTAAGYNVKELNLRKNDVPEDAELLIISNPITDFERGAENTSLKTEYDRLLDYAKRGGNFYVTIDPHIKTLYVLESFISGFGISFASIESGERMIVKDTSNAITTDGFTLVADYSDDAVAVRMSERASTRAEDFSDNVIIRDVAALNLSGNAKPLLVSSEAAVCQAEGITVDKSGSYTIAAYSTSVNDSADDAKIFVMSDGMLTANDAIITNGYSNKDFLFSLFDIFYVKGDMPYGCRSVVYNEQLLENLTMGAARGYTAILIAIPVLIAAAGIVVIVRRKNR